MTPFRQRREDECQSCGDNLNLRAGEVYLCGPCAQQLLAEERCADIPFLAYGEEEDEEDRKDDRS